MAFSTQKISTKGYHMKKIALLLALTGALGMTSVAQAIPIIYDFTGTVTAAYSFFTPVPIGAPVSGSFTYDPTTISTSYFYNYPYGNDIGILRQTVDYGQAVLSAPDITVQPETMLMAWSFTPYGEPTTSDYYHISINSINAADSTYSFFLWLPSNSVPILNLDAPSTLDFTGLSSGWFEYSATPIATYIAGDSFSGSIDTVSLRQSATVSEPATLALMSIGLAGIGFSMRCKRGLSIPAHSAC